MGISKMSNDNIFVKLDEYKEVYSLFEQMKKKMGSIKSTLSDIEKLKAQEDAEMDIWKSSINEIEQRVNNIEKSIFQD